MQCVILQEMFNCLLEIHCSLRLIFDHDGKPSGNGVLKIFKNDWLNLKTQIRESMCHSKGYEMYYGGRSPIYIHAITKIKYLRYSNFF